MAIEVLTQFLIPRVPQTIKEAARKEDLAGLGAGGGLPTFWIDDTTGDLMMTGEPGVFRINFTTGQMQYVIVTPD